MSTTVSMPQLGETVTEGTVLRWIKQVGDPIAEDEALVEISTDKVDTEIPSPVSGVVSDILVGEGETIEVGTAMVVISEEWEAETRILEPAPEPAAAAAPPTDEATPEPVPSRPVEDATPATKPRRRRPGPGQFLSPVVRRLAREHDIDPNDIEGTGRDGRVTRNDVLAYIDRIASRPAPEPAVEPAPAPSPIQAAPAAPHRHPLPPLL